MGKPLKREEGFALLSFNHHFLLGITAQGPGRRGWISRKVFTRKSISRQLCVYSPFSCKQKATGEMMKRLKQEL